MEEQLQEWLKTWKGGDNWEDFKRINLTCIKATSCNKEDFAKVNAEDEDYKWSKELSDYVWEKLHAS